MLFDAPIPFAEAIRYAASKQLLPTSLTSAELRTLGRELRRRSIFSARVTDGEFLHLFDDLVEEIVGGPGDEDFTARMAGERPLLMSIPDAKARLADYLEDVGYEPQPGDEGTLKDLRSNARRQLIVETNVLDTLGYGRWAAGQNTATLSQFPAQELVRMRFSKVPRDWQERWDAAREAAGMDGCTGADSGRLVALKNHPIWQELGDGAGGFTDTLGNPWPPFAFNSGMGVLDVNKADAIQLGIFEADSEPPKPQPIDRFNESAQASVEKWSAELKKALGRGDFKITDNGRVLSMANSGAFGPIRERLAIFLTGIESVDFANTGTTPGAFLGWETRRRGMVFSEADKGGGAGGGTGKYKEAVGKSGNWKSLGLPDAREIPANAPVPTRATRADAVEKLKSPYTKTDPLGHRVEFGERAQKHMHSHEGEMRPEWVPHAEATIEHPSEIWRDGNRLRHVAVFRGRDGKKAFLVASHQLHEHDSTIITFTPKDIRGVSHARKGTLLYVGY